VNLTLTTTNGQLALGARHHPCFQHR
jgi:hypothetical protein